MNYNTNRKYQSFQWTPEYAPLSSAGQKRSFNFVNQRVPPEKAILDARQLRNRNQALARERRLKGMLKAENKAKWQLATSKNVLNNRNNKEQGNKALDPQPHKAGNTQPGKTKPPEKQDKPKFNIVSHVEICNTQLMSLEQMDLVHATLMLEIEKCEPGNGPRFVAFFRRQGIILIICENYYSQEWLVKTIKKIKPWPEAELSTKLRTKPVIASTFLPGRGSDTVEKALKILKIQNKGLNTGEWKVLSEREYEGGHVVMFSIDRFSYEALKASKFKLVLGFRTIFLKIMTHPQPQKVCQNTKVIESPLEAKTTTENNVNQEPLNPQNEETSLDKDQVEKPAQDETMPMEQEQFNPEQTNQGVPELDQEQTNQGVPELN